MILVAGPNDAPTLTDMMSRLRQWLPYNSSNHLQIHILNLVPFSLLHFLGSYWRMLQAYWYSNEQLLQQRQKQDIRDNSVQISLSYLMVTFTARTSAGGQFHWLICWGNSPRLIDLNTTSLRSSCLLSWYVDWLNHNTTDIYFYNEYVVSATQMPEEALDGSLEQRTLSENYPGAWGEKCI